MQMALVQRRRILVALLIGGAATIIVLCYRIYVGEPSGDLFYPLCAAQALMQGDDPYGERCFIYDQEQFYPANPLTTTLAVYPFLLVLGNKVLVSALLPGIASGLLAYGITDRGQWWRLMVFASGVYWLCLRRSQWGILIAAIAMLPALLPLTLIKPHIGLPLVLTRATPRRIAACAAFVLVSLLIMPDWPMRYLRHGNLDTYTGFIPLLTLPLGPLLALSAVLIWKGRRSQRLWDLALYSLVPQRSLYDLAVLWTIPTTPAGMAALTVCSWLPLFAGPIIAPFVGPVTYPTLVVGCVYLPLLIAVFLERHLAVRREKRSLQAAT